MYGISGYILYKESVNLERFRHKCMVYIALYDIPHLILCLFVGDDMMLMKSSSTLTVADVNISMMIVRLKHSMIIKQTQLPIICSFAILNDENSTMSISYMSMHSIKTQTANSARLSHQRKEKIFLLHQSIASEY